MNNSKNSTEQKFNPSSNTVAVVYGPLPTMKKSIIRMAINKIAKVLSNITTNKNRKEK